MIVMSAHWPSLLEKKPIPSGLSYTIQSSYNSCSYFLEVSYVSSLHFTDWYQYSSWGLTSSVEKHTLISMCFTHYTFANTSQKGSSLCSNSNAFSHYSCTDRYFSFYSCLLHFSFLATVLCSCLGWTPSCWFWTTSPIYLDYFELKSGPSKYF